MSFIKSSCVPLVHTNIEKSSIMTNIWQNNLKKKKWVSGTRSASNQHSQLLLPKKLSFLLTIVHT